MILSPAVINLSILLLVAIMVAKELMISLGGRWRPMARYLNVPIVILLIIMFIALMQAIGSMSGSAS